MTSDQILKVLKTERECIKRQGDISKCNRRCGECDLCLPNDEILAVYDFLIGGYELMQNQGAEEYVIRCDTSKLSQEELDRLMGSIRDIRRRAVSIQTDIEPLSPDDMRKIMGMGDTE